MGGIININKTERKETDTRPRKKQDKRASEKQKEEKKNKAKDKIKTSNDSKCIQALTGIIETPIEGPGRYFVVPTIRRDQALVHMNAGVPMWKDLPSERHVSAVGREMIKTKESKRRKRKRKRS